MVDIDGVLSLFGGEHGLVGMPLPTTGPDDAHVGSLHSIEGIPHFLSRTAAAHLLELAGAYDLVWASGWEEKANEYLPRLLGLPRSLPFLRFARAPGAGTSTRAHWKLEAIEAYAGSRALAWIDDSFNPACHAWAKARPAATLLVQTVPERGLTAREAAQLASWAVQLSRA